MGMRTRAFAIMVVTAVAVVTFNFGIGALVRIPTHYAVALIIFGAGGMLIGMAALRHDHDHSPHVHPNHPDDQAVGVMTFFRDQDMHLYAILQTDREHLRPAELADALIVTGRAINEHGHPDDQP